MKQPTTPPAQPKPPVKQPWVPPTVQELPKLTDLTLTSGIDGDPIGGGPSAF